MKNTSKGSAAGLLLLGLFLGIAMVLSAYVVSTTLLRIKAAGEKITVKGFAERRVVSDVAAWTGKVVTRSHDLKSAYEKLEKDISTVLDYLKSHGIKSGRHGNFIRHHHDPLQADGKRHRHQRGGRLCPGAAYRCQLRRCPAHFKAVQRNRHR